MVSYHLSGRVVGQNLDSGLSAVRVEIWDSEEVTPDLLAFAVTGADGDFSITLDQDYLEQHVQDRAPALQIRCFWGNSAINTRYTLWKPTVRDTVVRILANLESTDNTHSPTSSSVRGVVRDAQGRPVTSATIKVYDRDLSGDTLLATTSTNSAGRYRTTYGALTHPDKVYADLVVIAYNGSGDVIATSDRYCRAPATATIDLVTAETYRGPSEFAQLEASIAPHIHDFDLTTATSTHIDWLACSSGSPREQVDARVAAAIIAAAIEIDAQIIYGLIREGLPSTRRELLLSRPADLQRALQSAADDNVIELSPSEITDALDQIREGTIGIAFETPPAGATGNLGALLDIVLADQETEERFLRLYLQHTGTPDEFWTDLAGETGFDGPGVVESLQFILQLGALTRFHFPLITELWNRKVSSTITSLKDLAAYSEAGWIAILQIEQAGVPIDYPADTPGANTTEKRANYAKVLKRAMEAAFPTAAIAATIAAVGSDPLTTFFGNNATFEFGKTRVGEYLAANASALTGIVDPGAATLRLKAIERLHKVTPRYEEMKVLLDAGLSSSRAITRAGRSRFVAKYHTALGGEDVAKNIFDNASVVAQHALALHTKLGAPYNPPSAYVLPDLNTLVDPKPAAFADYATLFGSPDFCEVDHCASVYGPAAYFVDLLHFLDRYDSTVTKSGSVKWTAKEVLIGSAPGSSPALLGRRPDLGLIDLTCENSDTPMPYVDLVNEILAYSVAALNMPSAPVIPDHLATVGTAEQLAAMPNPPQYKPPSEDLQDEAAWFTLAYDTLATSVYPWATPYNFRLDEARVYLKHLGVPRHALMWAFRPSNPGDVPLPAIRGEVLGLSPFERNVITGATSVAQADAWNTADHPPGGALPDALLGVFEIIMRTSIPYEDLVDLVESSCLARFGTPAIVPTGCRTLPEQAITGVTDVPAALDMIHRFVRLQRRLGWSVRELDQVLAAFTPTGTDVLSEGAIGAISVLTQVRARWTLPWAVLASWFGPLDMQRRDGGETPSFYEQLFQSKGVTNPVDAGLSMTAVASLTIADLITDHAPSILAGLRMSKEELALLTTGNGLDVPILVRYDSTDPALDGLATLHRVMTFCRAARLSVRDFLILYNLSEVKPFDKDAPESTLRFLETIDIARGAGIAPADLDYIFRDRVLSDAKLALTDATIDAILNQILDALLALRSKNEGADAAQETALIEDKLASALKLSAAAVHALFVDANPAPDTSKAILTVTAGGTQALFKAFMIPDPLPASPPDPPTLDSLGLRAGQRAAYRLAHKAATLVSRHRIRDDELVAMFGPTVTPVIDLNALRALDPGAGSLAQFTGWQNLVRLAGLRSSLKGNDPSLASLMTDTAANLSTAFGYSADDITSLQGKFALDTSWGDAAVWTENALRLHDALSALRRLGVSASDVVGAGSTPGWIDPADAHPAEIAEAIIRTAKAKYAEEDWNRVAPPLRDELRERLRAAMVAYLVAKYGYQDSDGLFASLLIDVETSPAVYTSRLKQAISSVQTFVQRIFLNLEGPSVPMPIALPEEATTEWAWRKSYRVWEANRKVFLHPEAYLDPSLRTDKSPLFQELESALRQKDITDETAEEAFEAYLDKLDEIGNLDVIAMCHQKEDGDDTHLPIDRLHVIGRTRLQPYKHFYRTREEGAYWTAWQSIDLDIDADQVILVCENRRPHLYWPMIEERSDEQQNIPKNKDTPGEKATTHLEIRMAWSELRGGRWTARRISSGNFTSTATSAKDQLSFIPQQPPDGPLRIDCLYPANGVGFLYGHFTRNGCGELEAANRAKGEPLLYILAQPLQTALVRQFDTRTDTPGPHLSIPITLNGLPSNPSLLGAPSPTFKLLLPHSFDSMVTTNLDTGRRGPDVFFYKDNKTNLFAELVLKTHTEWYSPTGTTPAGVPWNDVTGADVVLGRGGDTGLVAWAQSTPAATYFPRTHEDAKRYRFRPFYHPYACLFRGEFQRAGVDGLLKWSLHATDPLQLRENDFFPAYHPDLVNVVKPYPIEDVDFSFGGAYSLYNWELFFHAPFLIALRLMQNGRNEEAQRWFHFIFDPTTGEQGKSPQRFWKVRPFRENLDLASIEDELLHLAEEDQSPITKVIHAIFTGDDSDEKTDFSAQIDAWRKHPFEPHRIAQMRPIAYQKAVVLKYIENLIDWGDTLFRRETIEAINEATQLYILAGNLLGQRPPKLRAHDMAPMNYWQLEALGLGDFSDPLVGASSLVEAESLGNGPVVNPIFHPILEPPPDLGTLYFGVPGDETLGVLWNTVADRLFKIRHSLDIEGTFRQLPLFEPPIDPMLLVQATALGVDIAAAVSGAGLSLLPYRFPTVHGKALEMCGAVAGLGAALLGAMEKKDAEALSKLRSTQEIELLQLVREVKAQQVKEAEASVAALQRSLEAATIRRDYYANLKQISDAEQAALLMNVYGIELGAIGQAVSALAPPVETIPQITFGGAGMAASPVTITSLGGQASGAPIEAAGRVLGMLGSLLRDSSQVAATLAGYERRSEEWGLQLQLAAKDIQQIEKQIAAANIRLAVTQLELSNHERQQEHAAEVFAFLRDKRTNEDLYDWMVSELATVHHETYTVAYDLARRAEDVFRFEVGADAGEQKIVSFGQWDNLKQGLLAGERLQRDLRRLESAYLTRTTRELEITKHVSLAEVAPDKLMELRDTGSTKVSLTEEVFDGDYPGHYFRRIKSLAITVPTMTGAYASVNASVELGTSKIRRKASTGTYAPGGNLTPDVTLPARALLMTSSGVNDAGLFEQNLRDERFLPFEGAGAIADYTITLPLETNRFDVGSINDVILHIRYTARFEGTASEAAKIYYSDPENSPARRQLLSLRAELPAEWAAFMTAPEDSGDPQVLSIPLSPDMFPYMPSTKKIALDTVTFYARWAGKVSYGSDTALNMTLSRPIGGLNGVTLQKTGGTDSNIGKGPSDDDDPITFSSPGAEDLATWTLSVDSTSAGAIADQLQTDGRLNDTLQDILVLCKYYVVDALP